jgi:hypothetical protein
MLAVFNVDVREGAPFSQKPALIVYASVADGPTDADCRRYPAVRR